MGDFEWTVSSIRSKRQESPYQTAAIDYDEYDSGWPGGGCNSFPNSLLPFRLT